jgi:translocator protein
MNPDRLRQLLVTVTVLGAIAVNGAANAIPLNDQATGEISDRFRTFVAPAGYVFAIWGLIYIGQLAFVAHTLRPSRLRDPLLRRLGLWPALAAVFNGTWIFLWHWEVFPLTVVVMLGLLGSLLAIYVRGGFHETARPRSGISGADRWFVQVPFSIYLGWITVATIANVAVLGAWAAVPVFGLDLEVIAAAVLVVGFAIAALAVLRTADVAYGLVIVWAYTGIVVKEAAEATPIVPIVAGGAAGLVALLVIASLLGRLPLGPAGARRSAASA